MTKLDLAEQAGRERVLYLLELSVFNSARLNARFVVEDEVFKDTEMLKKSKNLKNDIEEAKERGIDVNFGMGTLMDYPSDKRLAKELKRDLCMS